MLFRFNAKFVFFLFLAIFTRPARSAEASGKLKFNRDIRPILSENCFRCHGPDKNQRKAKMRLDVREVAIEKEAIVPGKPEASGMVKHIFSTDPEEIMPPPEMHKKLSAAQKEILKQWIAEGAEYEPHWAYIKPVRPEIPKTKNPKWVRNPIDAFILNSLEAKKIQPSSEADKRTLLRRLSLDLIGLPPTLDELNAFLKDKSSKAYERQVDRLLASPHFGERMAVPWLDAARFSDSVGYHGDQGQRVFPYRDYVINSFNRNKPFDQFTVEQIAGDLLPNATTEQKIATGFNRLNMMTREGGSQQKEYLAKYGADRVRTIAGAWLGSTMGCCECHDHKYDPFSTRDFYSMEAFFADIKQWGVYENYAYTPNLELKGFTQDHPFPPEIEVDSFYLQQRLAKFRGKIDGLCAGVSEKLKSDSKQKTDFNNWCGASLAFLQQHTNGWASPLPAIEFSKKEINTNAGPKFVVMDDKRILFVGKGGDTKITLALAAGWISALRIELIPDEKSHSIVRAEDKNTAISFSADLKIKTAKKEKRLGFFHAEADRKTDRFANGESLIGVKDQWKISPDHHQEIQTAVWILDEPARVSDGDTLKIHLKENTVSCLRISLSPFAETEPLKSGGGPVLKKALAKSRWLRSRSERALVEKTFLLSTAWEPKTFSELRNIQHDALNCRDGRAMTMVTVSIKEPLTIRVLPRGNWQNDSGEIVQPAAPHFLPQIPNPENRRLTRLDLARWLVSKENPLTARTVMNRFWKQFFGNGISAVVDDLGAQGETPVHPELLDWLAVEFQESGWDVKHMMKLIVISSTYRQESNLRPELRDVDPANRLLSCQSPRRLEAEFVRDNALAISGLINLDLGGPSAYPYQPSGYYANIQFPERDYYADTDDRQYRRGVYTHWQRTFLHPMLANFDAPGREESTCTRNLSNTPQQALTLLNDPTFVESARVFAQALLLLKVNSDEERLDFAFEKALARSAKTKEKNSLKDFLAEERAHYKSHSDEVPKLLHVGFAPTAKNLDQAELAAWTSVCRVILNLHETITRY